VATLNLSVQIQMHQCVLLVTLCVSFL